MVHAAQDTDMNGHYDVTIDFHGIYRNIFHTPLYREQASSLIPRIILYDSPRWRNYPKCSRGDFEFHADFTPSCVGIVPRRTGCCERSPPSLVTQGLIDQRCLCNENSAVDLNVLTREYNWEYKAPFFA